MVALGAAHGGVFECVNEGFALDVGALVGIVNRWLFDGGAVFLAGFGCSVAAAGPFAFARTLVRSFGPVV